jgi:hypothetical protein
VVLKSRPGIILFAAMLVWPIGLENDKVGFAASYP